MRCALASSLLVGVSACSALEGPTLTAAAASPGELLVDGTGGSNPRTLPYRYYGTTELRALPPAPGADGQLLYAPATAQQVVDPPAPKWLFPLDFFIELVALPWRDDEVRAEVDLPPNPGRVRDDNTTPRGISELAERARQARAAR